MKKIIFSIFFVFLLGDSLHLSADLPGKPPSSINKSTVNPFQKPPPVKEAPGQHPRMPRAPTAVKEIGVPFLLPGIVGLKNGQWAGSDNLYNLRPDIGIYVELVMPEDQKFDINEHNIKERVEGIFSKAGINPVALREQGEPALPLYHVLIMLNQVDQCLTASCSCRLFESVTLKRVILEQGITFQAITWEKQDLISAAHKDFYSFLDKTIEDFTVSFVERFQYFQNLKFQRQGNR